MLCYEHGAFTLASGPSQLCLLHELPLGEQPPTGAYGIRAGTAPRRTPRGRGARRTTGPTSGPGLTSRALSPSRRARARGVARARARHRDGFVPHPGWRHFIDREYRVLTSQREALDYVARLVDDEDWRTDKRRSWAAILRRLVCHMDWETGLITGLTSHRLGAAGDRATRTVSRVLAWARDCGLLVVVEPGASAEFLSTDTGRTPTYALVTHTPPPHLAGPQHDEEPGTVSAGQTPVEESGDLPTTPVSTKPLTGGRRTHLTSQPKWHPYDVPDTPGARNAATRTLLSHLGLGGRKGGKIEIWRARALLKPWWDAGATVTGLLHALEYHPDRPDHRRGDLTSGARDPLRIIGARLRPWHGRLGEIRAVQIGHMRATTSGSAAASTAPAAAATRRDVASTRALLDRPAGRGARQSARDALSEHLRQLRETRGQHPHQPAPAARGVAARRLRRSRIRR
ncbi:hypothetical protein ACLFMI_14385 [Pseudonocardia nantongensis]|uniref:hypothetical protein n=1 Tax=Pseudonocardia nantongensis TaxID=1181885 RepID=UPI00397D7440